ncbi:hypothetical protein BEL04_20210 [Mucilaginibacter sp. PPCGB 2223]|uniref:S9 family peptidase n=1 Tax=Mucilaginibacter sp. PPCGB 2223 TaxID=1886027 RepID=UPI0008246DD2|nr:prolyl oligopeptidase family serine peptidase [Mucilaginibacter sp. PPCGB 2223]OCX51043.1 hypothetical protein BEL04_20210 [Mucilaginibacter sp. PPCGB 2223]
MLSRIKKFLFVAIVISIYSCGGKAPVLIPVGNFFNETTKSNYHISPDGKNISYLINHKRQQTLVIRSLADGKERSVSGLSDVRGDYFWTYSNQIIIPKYSFESNEFELSAIDVGTLQWHSLFKAGKVAFRVLTRKTKDPDVITCTTNERDSTALDVYWLNTKTGEKKMYLKNPGNVTEWVSDPDGKIRLAKASDGVNESILYRPNDDAKFTPIIVNNFKNRVEPIVFSDDRTHFYALSNVDRDKTALMEINATNIKDEKVIFSNDKADIEDVIYLRSKHRLDGVSWEEAKPQHYFLNAQIKAIYNDLLAKLPGNEVRIVDRDSTEDKMIINAYSDRNPGAYYLYTKADKSLVKLADMNADINPADLCEMKAISFKAGDGMVINGYLTLPQNTGGENLPVVVIPHNDAWKRNSWGYSAEVQFLANRGYAVFQVNHRGSAGYGKAFFSAGFKQAGGKMQQDITDGVNWLIDQKIANPKKIAIYGAGFGGFSALYGASFHPGMYNCVAVQNPLINLFTYVRDIPPFYKAMLSMRYEMVGNPENAADADQFRAISPVFNTDKLKVPLLFVQRENQRTNTTEVNQYVTELKRRGVPVTYKNIRMPGGPPGGGHGKMPGQYRHGGGGNGGVRESNRLLIYTELEKFLAANLQDKK